MGTMQLTGAEGEPNTVFSQDSKTKISYLLLYCIGGLLIEYMACI